MATRQPLGFNFSEALTHYSRTGNFRPMEERVSSKRSILLLVIVLLGSMAVFAQETKSDLSLNVTGDFSKHSSGNGIDLTPTQAAGFLSTYRYSFRPHQALELNYGYTRNSQNYSDGTSASVQSNVHEWTAAYVLKASSGKFQPFALAGTGVLIFGPTSNVDTSALEVSRQARAVFLYGVGADYNVTSHVALRAQYRGLLYKAPDFGLSDLTTNAKGHLAQPSLGLVFRF